MSSLFTNLLFLHGHITDPELARRLDNTPAPKPRPKGKRDATPSVVAAARKVLAPTELAHDRCG